MPKKVTIEIPDVELSAMAREQLATKIGSSVVEGLRLRQPPTDTPVARPQSVSELKTETVDVVVA
jgi:hypothetical protein